jgi:hypothetical protein
VEHHWRSPKCSTQCGDNSPPSKCGSASVATLSVCEFVFDQSTQMISYRLVIEALNDLVQEAADDEALGGWDRNAAGTEIKKLIRVDLAGGGTVRATDVVGENFKAGHRVGFGIVAQEKIAHFLIGVGEMGVRLDPDKAAERGAGAIVERVFVKEIARGMRRNVILQCARIKLLSAVCDRNCEQVAESAFAAEPAETLEARIFSAKMQIQAHGRRVMIYDCRVHLQGHDVGSPVLRADVSYFRARAGN